jgi:uncharacterized protein
MNQEQSKVEFIKNESTTNATFTSDTSNLPNPLPSNSDSKNIATLTHLSMILLMFPIVPILVYFLVKDDNFVKENAKEDINLYINILPLMIISSVLMVIIIGFITGFFILVAAFIAYIYLAVKSSEGKVFRIPYIIRLLN